MNRITYNCIYVSNINKIKLYNIFYKKYKIVNIKKPTKAFKSLVGKLNF